jgi:hypothetical protein
MLLTYADSHDYLFVTNALTQDIKAMYSDKLRSKGIDPEGINFEPTAKARTQMLGDYTKFPGGKYSTHRWWKLWEA